jgi:hypothetical protein
MSKLFLVSTLIAFAGSATTAQTLYNNGPLGTGPVAQNPAIGGSGPNAPAGFQWSEVASDGLVAPTEANTSAGFTGSLSSTTPPAFRLADDFVVPAGSSWDVTGFTTYGYQTGSALGAFPITGGTFNIWNGVPGGAGAIIGTATFDAMTNTNMYRIFNTVVGANPTGTTRLIRQVDWNVVGGSLTLGPGTYWIDFQYTLATPTATVFVPGVTIPGVRSLPGWNGRQLTTTGWVDAIDTGSPATAPDLAVDFPFIVKGIPAPGSLALLGLGGLVAARRRRS